MCAFTTNPHPDPLRKREANLSLVGGTSDREGIFVAFSPSPLNGEKVRVRDENTNNRTLGGGL